MLSNNNIKVVEVKSEEIWNSFLNKVTNFNFFSTYAWGNYKSNSWDVYRLAIYKKENFIGCIQILYKVKLGVFFGWSSSGVMIINWNNLDSILNEIRLYLCKKHRFYFLRINFFDTVNNTSSYKLDSISYLKKPMYFINSGYTVGFNLNEMELDIKNFSSNNRYYFKKSLSENLVFQISKEFQTDEFIKLHEEMANNKNISDLRISTSYINQLKNNLKDYLEFGYVKMNDEIVSSCIIFKKGDHAFYFLAASNQKGRDSFASFTMIHGLLKYLIQENVKYFDFGGITPFKKDAIGVNRFKMGFGGKIIKYLGERELSSHPVLLPFYNYILKLFK
jgi:lipid II:glycine glycyltransferase (peptidoglycan interpeptide bridge formation enzyme)